MDAKVNKSNRRVHNVVSDTDNEDGEHSPGTGKGGSGDDEVLVNGHMIKLLRGKGKGNSRTSKGKGDERSGANSTTSKIKAAIKDCDKISPKEKAQMDDVFKAQEIKKNGRAALSVLINEVGDLFLNAGRFDKGHKAIGNDIF